MFFIVPVSFKAQQWCLPQQPMSGHSGASRNLLLQQAPLDPQNEGQLPGVWEHESQHISPAFRKVPGKKSETLCEVVNTLSSKFFIIIDIICEILVLFPSSEHQNILSFHKRCASISNTVNPRISPGGLLSIFKFYMGV